MDKRTQKPHGKKVVIVMLQAVGGYYNTLATYLGYRFMELAFGKYRQGHCSIEQLAEHLNVKVRHLPQLEDCLLRKALR